MLKKLLGTILFGCFCTFFSIAQDDNAQYVNRFIGTSNNGAVSPAAAVPFGMVQVGANTSPTGSGYKYEDKNILGFSHVNKSGGGCGDFLDILFVPLNAGRFNESKLSYPKEGFATSFSHQDETAEPGYYKVSLAGLKAELTATPRTAFHKYTFSTPTGLLAIDLAYGNCGACTIVPGQNKDDVISSGIKLIDSVTVEGWRITSGWAKEQHVYFYAKFSKPVKSFYSFLNLAGDSTLSSLEGKDIRQLLKFDVKDDKVLLVQVGISPVSCAGAKRNLEAEGGRWDFVKAKENARALWNNELNKIAVTTSNAVQRSVFYTSLYNVMLYPMLFSDVDGQFRGPDHLVHQTKGFRYFGGVVGLWDTFRAAVPLTTIMNPGVVNEYVKTFLEHYKYVGQLPVWVLAGNETYQMLGLHSLPVIADAYLKNIGDFDVNRAYEAMKVSAMKDTVGFSMGYFTGLKNYKKYGYVPAELEMEATARTLEYSFDDWSLAMLAKKLGKAADYTYFFNRSKSYQNVFDKEMGFMNGRFSSGKFRRPFDPFHSSHRNDDFCEGNAWQWTFFAPHDLDGLAKLFGGKPGLIKKLDALFSVSSHLSGDASGDISGLIGQYAHGNEPSHHIPYMYTPLGQPWKTQKFVNQILTNLYDDMPSGICGNEDTGQMSAWYAFSSLGFYPMNPASQKYIIGSPLFDESVISMPGNKKFKVRTINRSIKNIYVKKAMLNGKVLSILELDHSDLMKGGELVLSMTDKPF